MFRLSPASKSYSPRVRKFARNLKGTLRASNVFILTVRSAKKRDKIKKTLKATVGKRGEDGKGRKEEKTLVVSFHARMIEGFYPKLAECPSIQLVAGSPREMKKPHALAAVRRANTLACRFVPRAFSKVLQNFYTAARDRE